MAGAPPCVKVSVPASFRTRWISHSDPQVLANDDIIRAEHPTVGSVPIVGHPLAFGVPPLSSPAADRSMGNTQKRSRWSS